MDEREIEKNYKIEVLRMGLLNEKQKSASLEESIKELRASMKDLELQLEKRDQEIVKHIKDKQTLVGQLDSIKHHSEGESTHNDNKLIHESGYKDPIKQTLEEPKFKPFSNFINNIGSLIGSAISKKEPDILEMESDEMQENPQDVSYDEKIELEDRIKTYEIAISSLETQNATLKELCADSYESLGKMKAEFQQIISGLNDKIRKVESEKFEISKSYQSEIKYLKEKLDLSTDEIAKYSKSVTAIVNQNKSWEMKINNLEQNNKKLQEESIITAEELKVSRALIPEIQAENLQLKDSIKRLESENLVLAKKLADLKFAILSENVRDKVFSGYKKEKNTSINFVMTFTKTDYGYYVISIKDENQKDSETILIDDIDNMKVSEETSNSVEIKYIKDKKLKTVIYFMNDNVFEVVKTFKEYREKALKQASESFI